MFFALVLVTAFAALFAVGPAQVALAHEGVNGHTFNVTFTKWLTTYPNMVGVVGGAVGVGAFKGEILTYNDNGTVTLIEAMYHMNGSRHSFTADVHVTESDATGLAVVTGRVTEGWMEDATVTGEFKTLANCTGHMSGPCFQGALKIHPGTE